MGLGPRLDCPLLDGLVRVGYDQVHIQLDDVPKAVARGAGAERIVEGEKTRLRILVGDPAGAALEAL